jgi:hypothetical protein
MRYVAVPTAFGREWLTNGLPQNLSKVFRAVAAGLDDTELPVRVHAALTLTEMVSSHDSIKAAVSPQVGKVIQGLAHMHRSC